MFKSDDAWKAFEARGNMGREICVAFGFCLVISSSQPLQRPRTDRGVGGGMSYSTMLKAKVTKFGFMDAME